MTTGRSNRLPIRHAGAKQPRLDFYAEIECVGTDRYFVSLIAREPGGAEWIADSGVAGTMVAARAIGEVLLRGWNATKEG